MSEYVGIREFKARLSHYLRKAAGGERLVVTQHGRPLAEILPFNDSPEARIQSMVSAGKAKWSGRKPSLRAPVSAAYPGRSVASLVLRDRE